MTIPELKDCPFCGGAAVKGYSSGAVTHIYCMDCRATTHYQCREQEAVDSWNTRAPQPQSGDMAKALDALQHLEDSLDGYGAKYEIETIRAALTQPEFEVVDVAEIEKAIYETIDYDVGHYPPTYEETLLFVTKHCGFQIVRKKGGA